MGKSDDLVDAILYTYAWLHKVPISKLEPVTWKNTLLGSYYRNNDGDRLPMSKGTMKDKVRIEFNTLHEANESHYIFRSMYGAYSEYTHRTLDLTFYGDGKIDRDELLLKIFKILQISKSGWQIVGPRCPEASNNHATDNVNMLWQLTGWRCTQRGCGKFTSKEENTGLLTFHEIREAISRAEKNRLEKKTIPEVVADITKKAKIAEAYGMGTSKFAQLLMRDIKESFPVIPIIDDRATRAAAREYAQNLMAMSGAVSRETMKNMLGELPSVAPQVHDEIILPDLASKIKDLESKLTAELNKFQSLASTTDTMFRFLSGLNMQDHSIADQKQFLVLMRELKVALNSAGIGSKD